VSAAGLRPYTGAHDLLVANAIAHGHPPAGRVLTAVYARITAGYHH